MRGPVPAWVSLVPGAIPPPPAPSGGQKPRCTWGGPRRGPATTAPPRALGWAPASPTRPLGWSRRRDRGLRSNSGTPPPRLCAPVLGPALRSSFPVAPPAAQFPGDCFPATARVGRSCPSTPRQRRRGPASGSGARAGPACGCDAAGGSGWSAEAQVWHARPPGSAAPRVGHVPFLGLTSRVRKTGARTGLQGSTARKSLL